MFLSEQEHCSELTSAKYYINLLALKWIVRPQKIHELFTKLPWKTKEDILKNVSYSENQWGVNLITNIVQNIICVLQKETHTGLD